MAINDAHWTVTRADGNIRYTGADHGVGGESYATVLDLHRWLQDLADDESSGSSNDQVDITDTDPSARSTDNYITLLGNFNIDDTAAEHLYDGSIVQGTGDTQTIYDGIVNYGNSTVQIQLFQDGAVLSDDWWNQSGIGLNPDATSGISHRFLVKVREYGADLDGRRLIGTCRTFGNTYSEFKIAGTSRGNNTLALVDADDLNNEEAVGTVATWTTIDNTTEGYANIDANNDTTDEYYYSEWNRATYTINQFYERMKWLTRDGSASTLYGVNGEVMRGITHEIEYDTITNGGPVELNHLCWGTTFNYSAELASGLTVGAYYDFNTGGAKGKLIALDDDGSTGFCVFQMETYAAGYTAPVNTETFTRSDGTATDGATVNSAPVGGTNNGGYAIVLADDAGSPDGVCWIQLLCGTAPSDGYAMYKATTAGVHDTAADGTCAVDINITERTISKPFCGSSTGSALLGAYGFGLEKDDLSKDDRVTDLTDTVNEPPNTVTFTVYGIVSGDRVLVTEDDTNKILYAQYTLNGGHAASSGTITVNGTIDSDTPSSGTIRVYNDDNEYMRLPYTSFTGSVFTLTGTTPTGASNAANVFISYVDKETTTTSEAFSYVYSIGNGARTMFVRVREGSSGTPIKTAETTGTMSDSGGSATVNRVDDY